jgi:hypothetical protein
MAVFRTPAFEMSFPSAWTDLTTYIVAGPEDEETGFRANVVVQHRESEKSAILETVARAEIAAVGEALDDPELLDEGSLPGCAVEAYGATWTWTTEEGLGLFQRQVYMQTSSRLYILTCTCLKRDRNILDEAFLRMLATFQPST